MPEEIPDPGYNEGEWRGGHMSRVTGLLQGLDQEEDLGSHRVVQLRHVGEAVVAATGEHGLGHGEGDAVFTVVVLTAVATRLL